MQPQKAFLPLPPAAPIDLDGDDTVSDLTAESLRIGAAHTVAADERVTMTTPPEDGDETTSLAVTFEQPGRYGGPRRGGRVQEGPIELGRGGIGRVLIAHDAHLGREVAVKELLQRSDGPIGSRASTNPRESLAVSRFLREARLTGQLEHPNIVPVYELGTRADGTLYYTMKVVRGRNLASALASVEGDGLRARMKFLNHYADLCDAIAYAHSRGVIHRDIKPENVMVGEFGETVVLDWGLAKPKNAKDLRGDEAAVADSEAPTVDIHGVTQAATTAQPSSKSVAERTTDPGKGLAATDDGTLLGTPMYMSPEQAQGDLTAIDERSDVWALGVVLYEILTGETPFLAKTAIELLLKIVNGTFDKVVSKVPEAPPELAAIAEKALSRDPADRYPDARAMAEEVRTFLTGGRVQAYNYRPWILVKRWAAKHKGALVVAALAVVALIALGIVSYIQIADERDRAMQAETEAVQSMHAATAALARAEVAEGEARRSRDSAETLVRYMVSDLKDRLEPLGQLALLGSIASAIDRHYDDTAGVLTADGPNAHALEDPARVRNRAAVTALMGDVARTRGDLAQAAAAYDKAEMLRIALLAKSDLPEHRADRAESYRQRGLLLRSQGDLPGAQAELGRARTIRTELFAAQPESLPGRRALVQSELDRGDLAALLGDLRQSETAFVSAVELARGLVKLATEPDLNERARFDLSVALDGVGTAHLDMNQLVPARKAFEEALELRKALLEKRPSNLDWRHRMAVSHARLGEIDEQENKLDDAQKHWQRAASTMERLVKQDGENARWARDLVIDLNHLGDLQLRGNANDLALASFAKALDQIQTLAAKDTSNVEVQRDVEVGENRVGDASLALGKLADALASYERGLAVAERLAAKDPSNTRWQYDLAHSSSTVALARARIGDLVNARPQAVRAVSILEALSVRDTTNAGWQRDLGAARTLVARIDAGGPFDGLGPSAAQTQRPEGLRSQDQRPAAENSKEVMRPQPQRPAAESSKDVMLPQPQRPAASAPMPAPNAPEQVPAKEPPPTTP